MAATYNLTQNETRKQPRRHVNDPSQEWTMVITRYMAELMQKVQEYYGCGQTAAAAMAPGFLTAGNQVDIDAVSKQWAYCDKLSLHLYQEGLIDRQEYLSWAIDLLENTQGVDDNVLRITLALVYQVTTQNIA